MMTDDTIAAFASPVIPCGRVVLRISGPLSHGVVASVCPGHQRDSATALQRMLQFSGFCFPAWIYSLVGPHSYTGDDSVELHLPGNPLLAGELLSMLLKSGIRLAEPGEFTARAFFNGKLDLTEAEGVAAVISAADAASAQSARQLLSGELARRLRPIMNQLSQTLALVEAEIDFSEEDISFLSEDSLRSAISTAQTELKNLLNGSVRFRPLAHEPVIALAGRPNAGKSTLMNALVGGDRAVVSDEAGTTRDVLSATLTLPGGVVTLQDLAGLEPTTTAGSKIELEVATAMQQRATHAASTADALVLIIAADDPRPPIELNVVPSLIVITKSELADSANNGLRVSVHHGQGLDALRAELNRIAFSIAGGQTLMLNERHERNIRLAFESLIRAEAELNTAQAELVAAELRRALDELGSVLGTITPDDILGQIFSTFCIGK